MTGFESVWKSLLGGDPGPAVALIDTLIENDFPTAAGGLLSDLAERLVDADTALEDPAERERFVKAVEDVLRYALPEQSEYDMLIAEAQGE